VYYGLGYSRQTDALLAFISEAQKPVTGEVTLGRIKGNCLVQSRSAQTARYDEASPLEGGGVKTRPRRGFSPDNGAPGGLRPGPGGDRTERIIRVVDEVASAIIHGLRYGLTALLPLLSISRERYRRRVGMPLSGPRLAAGRRNGLWRGDEWPALFILGNTSR